METEGYNAEFTWAVIGPGQIARDFVCDMHLVSAFSTSVKAVLSSDLEEARAFTEQHDIPGYYDDLQQMLREVRPDMVYIATPHTFHADYALRCMDSGVGVLCEKPMGINSRQVERMVKTARARHTLLMEGMWIRYLPSIGRLLALLNDGRVGAIHSIEANMSFRAPRDPENRFYSQWLGGGSLLDLGIYPVYLAVLVLGEPESVQAHALVNESGIDEGCIAILGYGRKAYALAESSLIIETDKTAVISGEKGSVRLAAPWNEKSPGIQVHLFDQKPVFYPLDWPGRGFQYEITEALRCLGEKRIESDLHNHQMSLAVARVLDEIRRQTGIVYPGEPQP